MMMSKGVNINIVLLGLVGLMLIMSCNKKLSSSYQSVDTFWIQNVEIERDTFIRVPDAKIHIELDSLLELNREAKQAKLDIRKDKETGTWNIDCICDTFSILAKLKDKESVITHKKIEKESVVEKEKYIPEWVRVLAIIGAGIIVFFIMRFVLIFK